MLDVKKFKYQILNPKTPTKDNQRFYTDVFNMWAETWESAYKVYWNSSDIFSDQFTRQSYQGVLTYEDKIVGSLAFDEKNMNLPSVRKDSYFRMWDDLSYNKLKNQGDDGKVLVCSWYTLNKEWRKSSQGLNAKELLLAVAVKELEVSGVAVMSGTMVHVGRLHEICYELNATEILKNTEEKGLPIDLLMWKREDVKGMSYLDYDSLLDHIFADRVDEVLTKPDDLASY